MMPDKKKIFSFRAAAAKKQNRRDVPPPEENDDMLAEFSHGDDDFYVDEVAENARRNPQPERGSRPERKERPQKKRRERKPLTPLQRKISRIVSYCLIVAIILSVGVVLSLTVLFKTQRYEVAGTERYTAEELTEVCGIHEGENIFLAPKSPAERRIKNKFPYVEDVDVTFKIPDTIKINITEADEGYLIKTSDTEYTLISTKGRILDKVEDISGYDLPIFIGPSPSSGEIGDYVEYEDETVMKIINKISSTFAENGYQGITEIDATNPANVSFTYDGRIKVKLGLPEDLSYKVRTAMTIINENIDINTTAKIEGVLDVSRCNVTKKSYFDEKPLLDINIDPTASTDSTDSTENTAESQSGGSVFDNFGLGSDTSSESEESGDAEPKEDLPVEDWYL